MQNLENLEYKYTLPPLPYAFGALEPYIDALTMEIHHDGHHKAYVDNLNAALEKHADLQSKTLEHLLTHLDNIKDTELRTAIKNNGGGHINHSFFWKIMKKGGSVPKGMVLDAIKEKFESFDAFQNQFNVTAKKVFGSGWAWLCVDKNSELLITHTANQDTPLSQGFYPVLGLDVWEHAYYLKYHNKRPDYINAWWNVINWEQIEENYRELVS